MSTYLINGKRVSKEDPHWQTYLADAHRAKDIAACCCRSQTSPPKLYIAKLSGGYVLKRMPFTGATHSTECSHYETPPELSGMAQVNGAAIKVNTTTGMATLLFDFPLTKGKSRGPLTPSTMEEDSVRADGTKLTLRAALHYLYDEANLTQWVPRMQGKRSWKVVRRELLTAAEQMTTKGYALNELLFIPETFDLDRMTDIEVRASLSLRRLIESPDNRMVVIGEVKAIEEAKFGYKLVVKHLPNKPLHLPDDLYKRVIKAFAGQLEMWGQTEDGHLLVVGTFFRSASGVFSLDRASFMNVNAHWIPYDNLDDLALINELHAQSRLFKRSLRYNLKSSELIATATLQDTGEDATALFITHSTTAGKYLEISESLASERSMKSWVWPVHETAIPSLPPVVPYTKPAQLDESPSTH